MAKYTPEELKQIRLNNLSKGRIGKGRPKGSKNKVTRKKIENLIQQFLESENKENLTRSDIVKKELKLDLTDTNQEQEKITEKIIKQESVLEKENTKEQQKEEKPDTEEKPTEKQKETDIFGFEF